MISTNFLEIVKVGKNVVNIQGTPRGILPQHRQIRAKQIEISILGFRRVSIVLFLNCHISIAFSQSFKLTLYNISGKPI